ncbi:MAG: hypothetical protein ACE5LB_15240 [Acidiferrobacterales bacterium]
MGFFSKILGSAAKIAGRFFGFGGAPAAPVQRAIGAGGSLVRRGARFVGRGAAALGGAAAVGGAFQAGSELVEGDGVVGGVVGGNGVSFRRTLVQTVDRRTGQVVRTEVLRGRPYLMQRDVQIAKRVFRQSRALEGRLPKKRVRQSRRSMLHQAVEERVLQSVARSADKCT